MRANVTKSGSNTSTNYDIHNSKRSATMMRMCMKKQLPLARARSGPLWGEMQGPAESDALTDVDDAEVDAAEGVETRARLRGTHVTTWMMPMCVSLLHRECRRGLVLEPAGTLAMTRKMLLLIKARNRRPVRAWRWMHDRQMRTRAKP